MSKQTAHPSEEKLSAYNRGVLPPDEAVVIETHISDCESCCETIVGLSSDDTFVGLLKEARQLPVDQNLKHDFQGAKPSSISGDIPPELVEHPRYEIIRLIGKGGMGDVYEAIHRKMERRVALKVINRKLFQKAEAVNRFHREVKTAAQLSHLNIVTSHDADQAGDYHFMVMEYVDGVDLSQIVKNQGALPVADACDYISQAAIGLQHAHERGMVHRDVKPHNLMVTEDGTVKILDFGLASLSPETIPGSGSVEADGELTAAGAIMGTPDFISPEQANDARQVDIRSDIYSLGVTLYYLLSGRPPFDDGSVMYKLKSHAQIEPASLATLRDDVPDELVAIVSRMMAKDPNERYLTPSEVADALESFLQTWQPGEAKPQEREPSSGGNRSGSSVDNAGAGDMSPNWLSVLAKWLFYISLIPAMLIVVDVFLLDDDTDAIIAAGNRTWYYMLATVCLLSVAAIASCVHTFKSEISHQNDNRIFRLTTDQTLLIAAILIGAGVYLFSLAGANNPSSIIAGGAGVGGEEWYFSSGNTYLKQDEPGVLFGLYEDPSGDRGFTYVVLVRHNTLNYAEASIATDPSLKFDGKTASIKDGITIDNKGIKLDLEVLVSKSRIESTKLAVDGNSADATRGKVFLVDVTSDQAVWNQVDAVLPLDLPAPQSVASDTKLVAELAQQLTEQLAQDNSSVREFLAGTLPVSPAIEDGFDIDAGVRPNVNVASYSAEDGHHWQLVTQKVEAVRIRLLHITNGKLEVACESVLRDDGNETSIIDLILSQTELTDKPESSTTTVEIASDDLQFSSSKTGPLTVEGTFQVRPVVTSGNLAWNQPNILYHLADWSGDLTYRRSMESMIEASRDNAKFVALEVEWVAKGALEVPEWFAQNQQEAKQADSQSDLVAIQGDWRVIFAEDSGRTGPPGALQDIRFAITRDTLTMDIAGRKVVSTYKLDPTTDPKSIDLTTGGRTKPGIYDLQGDTLRICTSEKTDERPTAFDSQPDSVNDVVLTLKRVKIDKDSKAESDRQKHNGPLSEELARSLIPKAASISNGDFQKLQSNPTINSIQNESLSLVLLTLDVRDQSPKAASDFRFLVEGFLKPSEIAAAMSLSRSKGYMSIIQPEYITGCTITNSGKETASGKITFNAPQLYIGSVDFEARKHEGKWRIEKFQLQSRQISVVLGEDGEWHRESNEQ